MMMASVSWSGVVRDVIVVMIVTYFCTSERKKNKSL